MVGKIDNPIVHKVRNVSPVKEMMCISFKLPAEFAYSCSGDDKKRKGELLVKE